MMCHRVNDELWVRERGTLIAKRERERERKGEKEWTGET